MMTWFTSAVERSMTSRTRGAGAASRARPDSPSTTVTKRARALDIAELPLASARADEMT